MRIDEKPRHQKRCVFVTRDQIMKAAQDFQRDIDREQSGWYRFDEYCTESEMDKHELRAMVRKIQELRAENEMLREIE